MTAQDGSLYTSTVYKEDCYSCGGTGETIEYNEWIPEYSTTCMSHGCHNGTITETVVTERYLSGMPKKSHVVTKKCSSCNGTGQKIIPGHYEKRYKPKW